MAGIGDTLREARLSRGLTHEYVSQIIKIRPEFLAALEDEDDDALPGAFYAKNFLRRYADFLGLDSAPLVERYVARESGPAQSAEAVVVGGTNRPPGGRHWRPNYGIGVALLLLGVAGLVLAYSTFVVPRDRNREAQALMQPTPSQFAVAEVPTSAPTPTARPRPRNTPPRQTVGKSAARVATRSAKPKASGRPVSTATRRRKRASATATARPTNTPRPRATRTPKPSPTPQPVGAIVASIRTLTPTDVTVQSDGKTVFQGTISPEGTRLFAADGALRVHSRGARGVLVSVNDCAERTLESYGCPGCVEAYFTFPRDYADCR